MNYFIEGLQGSGKSTLAGKLSEKCGGRLFREGDYSPVELAWCAYLSEDCLEEIMARHPDLRTKTEAQTFDEDGRKIVCYTRIPTEDTGFYKDMEQHEIYNGRLPLDKFKDIVLKRYRAWNGSGQIFECSLFQNTIEDMILFRDLPDEEIIGFYREAAKALEGKDFRIVYLKTENIAQSILVIRKERTDGREKEIWYDMMLGFFNNSLYAKAHGVSGNGAMIEHFAHRQQLELRICREIFPDRSIILGSKGYTDDDIEKITKGAWKL